MWNVSGVSLALAFAAAAIAQDGAADMTGWVSDAACGVRHTKPGGADCVRKCIKGAVHLNPGWKPQKMVLVADPEHRIYVVENPERLEGREGLHVTVRARVKANGDSVHILEVVSR